MSGHGAFLPAVAGAGKKEAVYTGMPYHMYQQGLLPPWGCSHTVKLAIICSVQLRPATAREMLVTAHPAISCRFTNEVTFAAAQ